MILSRYRISATINTRTLHLINFLFLFPNFFHSNSKASLVHFRGHRRGPRFESTFSNGWGASGGCGSKQQTSRLGQSWTNFQGRLCQRKHGCGWNRYDGSSKVCRLLLAVKICVFSKEVANQNTLLQNYIFVHKHSCLLTLLNWSWSDEILVLNRLVFIEKILFSILPKFLFLLLIVMMSSHIVLSSRSFQLLLSHSMPKKPCQQQHSSWSQCSPAFDDVYSVAWERKACGLFLRATATAFVTCGSARPLSKAKPCPKDDGSNM